MLHTPSVPPPHFSREITEPNRIQPHLVQPNQTNQPQQEPADGYRRGSYRPEEVQPLLHRGAIGAPLQWVVRGRYFVHGELPGHPLPGLRRRDQPTKRNTKNAMLSSQAPKQRYTVCVIVMTPPTYPTPPPFFRPNLSTLSIYAKGGSQFIFLSTVTHDALQDLKQPVPFTFF